MRKTLLIVNTVVLEAVRRKEIYAIVLLSCVAIGAVASVPFFDVPQLVKFYYEMALKIMGLASAVTVVALGARQLPREFERRTVYTLMAKPVGRSQFLLGKFLGVVGAGAFCYGLFALIFLGGCLYLRAKIHWGLLLQHIYLQLWMLAIVGSLAFMLSLIGNLDMAVTVTMLLYLLAQTYTAAVSYVYGHVGPVAQFFLRVLNYLVPQLRLLDLSGKVVHGEIWGPISAGTMGGLSLYAAIYVGVFLAISYLLFRRRAL